MTAFTPASGETPPPDSVHPRESSPDTPTSVSRLNETIRGFVSAEHANAFARRYVRDSLELCRARGMDSKEVLAAWFAFGEDAEVLGAGDEAWSSATELAGFAAYPPEDEEERDWRALDPRRDGEGDEEEDEA